MTGRQHWWTALASAAITMMGPVALMAQGPQAAADDGATFSATVVVAHAIVDGKGQPVRELPSARYRLSQLADGRLRLVSLASAEPTTGGPLANRSAGVTVQANPATGRIEVRDSKGVSVALPSEAAWVEASREPEALVATSAGRNARRMAIERTFGRSLGRLRGKERFLERSGSHTRELLVSSDTALPSELNIVEGGALVERHTFEYARTSTGDWVRRRMSSEAIMPGASGQRLVAVTTFEDVQVAAGGVR